jgi:hypothetical protein
VFLLLFHNSNYSGKIDDGKYNSNGFSVIRTNHSSYIPCLRPINIGTGNRFDIRKATLNVSSKLLRTYR